MKTYLIFDPSRLVALEEIQSVAIDVEEAESPLDRMRRIFAPGVPIIEVEADFLYAQPSGTTTLHRFRAANTGGAGKSDIVAVVPSNLLILEV